jgi:hypothetical protein
MLQDRIKLLLAVSLACAFLLSLLEESRSPDREAPQPTAALARVPRPALSTSSMR